jgi:hypothetical protein
MKSTTYITAHPRTLSKRSVDRVASFANKNAELNKGNQLRVRIRTDEPSPQIRRRYSASVFARAYGWQRIDREVVSLTVVALVLPSNPFAVAVVVDVVHEHTPLSK